jgi:hypothetical protein
MRLRLLVLLGLALCASASAAQEPGPKRLGLSPAAEPSPALRHTLLPEPPDMEHGNAAVGYCTAALLAAEVPEGPAVTLMNLLSTPLAEMDLGQAREALEPFEDVIRYTAIAARQHPVDWDLPLPEGYAMKIPALAHLRMIGRAIALKARVEIAEGRFEEALDTLATGTALARDLGKAPTLIHGLVGIAVGSMMLDTVEDFVSQPGSPNLYWALAMLPDPPVSMARGLATERYSLVFWRPVLGDPLKANLTPEGWAELFADALGVAEGVRGGRSSGVHPAVGIALATYPDARRHLVEERGLSPEEVERMPVLQAVAVYLMDGYRRIADEGYKWFYVDYATFCRQRAPMEDALRAASKDKGSLLPKLLLPALERAYAQQMLLPRRVDALRVVEALRMHAATHGGSLPASLADVTIVPVPSDIVTGGPFGYERTGTVARLTAPPASPSGPATAIDYELTIEREE